MGGKKAKGGKGKGKGKKGAEEEDLSTEQLERAYARKCRENGVKRLRQMIDYFDQYYEEDEHIKKAHFHSPTMGPKGAKALMEALIKVK